MFRPADWILHTTLLTDVYQFFQATSGALLAALCAALKFLEFTVSLLDFAWCELRWCAADRADRSRLEGSKADRAGADCWCGGVVALTAWLAVEGPCTEIIRPTMAVDVADVI